MPDISRTKLTAVLAVTYGLFAVGTTFSIAFAQMMLGLTLVMFVIWLTRYQGNPLAGEIRWFYWSVAAYVGWLVLSSLFSETPLRSVVSVREDWLFVIIPIGTSLMVFPRFRRRLLVAFAVGVGVISVYAIVQFFTGLDFHHDYPLIAAGDFGYRARGNFGGRLTFGNYYAAAGMFLLPFGLWPGLDLGAKQRRWYAAVGCLACVAAVLSFSRGPIISLVVAAVCLGAVLGRKQLLVVLAVLAIGAVTAILALPGLSARFEKIGSRDLDPTYEGGRLFIWSNSVQMIKEHPITGVGISNFNKYYAEKLRPDILDHRKHAHAHNDFLSISANNGLPAGALFVVMWLVLLRYLWRGWRAPPGGNVEAQRYSVAALIASVTFALTTITEATFADEEVRQMLMFVWAMGLWPWYNGQASNSEKS